jgi:acetyl-CoA carboxylase carboxyl transferase subunit alpha
VALQSHDFASFSRARSRRELACLPATPNQSHAGTYLSEVTTLLTPKLASAERRKLAAERPRLTQQLGERLAPIERVRRARDPARPQTLDYVELLARDFFEIHGDRRYADDEAIVAGLGYWGRAPVAIAGHQRGRSTAERLRRNFGRPHPEGYRKVARLLDLAARFGLPLITFVDTQGAEPGIGAEERGQAEAIAANLLLMARVTIPIITCVIGEGGSGGALALAVANRVLMQENACYAVITPEGCAAILWRDAGQEKVAEAATVLRLSAPDLMALKIIDEIIPEPPGGAHRDQATAIKLVGAAISRHLTSLRRMKPLDLRHDRERKFAVMGNQFLSPDGCRLSRRSGK